jgi:hypothetical protein
MGWIRRHLTYANAMATVAVFIALGGGAYAAFHVPKNSVRSKSIANGAIKGKDLKKSAITGKTIKNKSVKDADIQDLETSDGLVRMEPGDSTPLLSRGPFTLTASCRVEPQTDGSEETISEVVADSSVPDGMFTSENGGSGPIPPQRSIANAGNYGQDPDMGSQTFVLATPDGTTVTGFAAAGVNSLGSTCYALATGLGGTGLPAG